MIIIYTGVGKGKTSAALGLIIRAVAASKKVALLQFIKSRQTGEHTILKERFPEVYVEMLGLGFVGILGDKKELKEHKAAAKKGLIRTQRLIESFNYDIIILDEICGTISAGLIQEGDVIKIIENKPKELTLVLTGRNASQKLINCADLVTEMKKVKHPFDKGMQAIKGIDL